MTPRINCAGHRGMVGARRLYEVSGVHPYVLPWLECRMIMIIWRFLHG